MATGRGRWLVGALALVIALLFLGRGIATFLTDRWWAAVVAPAAVGPLTRWHLLTLLLEGAGVAGAAAWCIAHLFLVIGSIDAIQVPRRLGDLEIRELLPPAQFRGWAVVAGLLLGSLVASGSGGALPVVLEAWHGVHVGVPDPILGVDLGTYLVQLPLWDLLLGDARLLVWVGLAIAGVGHWAVGGLRVSRGGLAMTDTARSQLGLLIGALLLLAAAGEGVAPLRVIAGLDHGALASLPAVGRWAIAVAWGSAALIIALWTSYPAPRRLLLALMLWVLPLLLGTLAAATIEPAATGELVGSIGARAVGAERLTETTLSGSGRIDRVEPGLWTRGVVPVLVGDHPETRLLAGAPIRASIGTDRIAAWLLLRTDSTGGSLLLVADDRLGPGGTPVSFREGDPTPYPGLVTWRPLPTAEVIPEAADTVVAANAGGIAIGGTMRRLLLGWGTQSSAVLRSSAEGGTLWWRRSPRERVRQLFPPAWWDEPRPALLGGRLVWVVDGWFVKEGAPMARPIPWEGGAVRYARPGLVALVDAEGGGVTFYLRPTADQVAEGWAALADGMILPADSLPPGLLESSPSEREVAVVGAALRTVPELPRPLMAWGPRGAAYEIPLVADSSAGSSTQRLQGLLFNAGVEGFLVVRWPEGERPFAPGALNVQWDRFTTLERLEDSVRRAGGQLQRGEVRYDLSTVATLGVRVRWAVSSTGVPTVAWVELAQGDRLGAARTPVTALENLRGESAPLVPAPELPDALGEARRWAARADSALRAGDLEAFGRAFGALKRILGTP